MGISVFSQESYKDPTNGHLCTTYKDKNKNIIGYTDMYKDPSAIIHTTYKDENKNIIGRKSYKEDSNFKHINYKDKSGKLTGSEIYSKYSSTSSTIFNSNPDLLKVLDKAKPKFPERKPSKKDRIPVPENVNAQIERMKKMIPKNSKSKQFEFPF